MYHVQTVFTIQSHTPFPSGTIDIPRERNGSRYQHKVFYIGDEQDTGKGSVPLKPFSLEGIYTNLSNKETKVNGLDERRTENRYRNDAPVIFQMPSAFGYHRAKKLNHSNNGVSFEGDVGLKPGTIVYIRREKCPENCSKGDTSLILPSPLILPAVVIIPTSKIGD